MAPALILAVLVYGSGSPDAGPELRAKLTAALRARGATVIDQAVDAALADRQAGWRPVAELGYFAEARTVLERARRARERVELDEALRASAQAEANYAAHLEDPGVAAILGDAILERGVAAFEAGRTEEARTAFRRALDLAPDLSLTERHARPDVVRLFRELSRAPRTAREPPAPRSDPQAPVLLALRTGPSPDAASALVEALALDGAIVVAVSTDGQRAIAARTAPGCATGTAPLALDRIEASLTGLLAAACDRPRLALELDDGRLRPPPPPVVVAASPVKHRRGRTWPWVFVGALGVTAVVLGVTVGVVAADPKYALRVDGRSFGAP